MKKKHKIILVIGLVLSTILALLASLLAFSAKWMFKTWTNLTMDELVYHLTAPLEPRIRKTGIGISISRELC